MDKETRVHEVGDGEMENLILFRKKRQATRASWELGKRLRDRKKEPEVGTALAHTRSRGFKWCVTESDRPVRRR